MRFLRYNNRDMGRRHHLENFRDKSNNWLYDHLWARRTLSFLWLFFLSTLSALVFSIGFECFMDPGDDLGRIVSGGVSGLSQVLTLFFEICGWTNIDVNLAYSILYFVLNIPVILLGWFGIGKKFTIYTLINVVEVSLFMNWLSPTNIGLMREMAIFVNNNGGFLSRALFGGVCTGLSAAICYKGDFSTGGIDVIAFYISLRKKTMVGKYSAFLNGLIVVLFTLLECIQVRFAFAASAETLAKVFYSAMYLLASMLVVDTINVRNKKMKIEIVSSNRELGDDLISAIPHGVTLIHGEGVYSGNPRYIFTMVVSSYELNEAIRLIKKKDPSSFINVTTLQQVYGRFHTKPVK